MSFSRFEPSFLTFFEELRANNSREWFEANKPRFKSDVQAPLIRFVEAMAPRLAEISGEIDADPRPNGKTIFRIYRDVRFSKDKRPYKEHAACHFRHKSEKDVHGPGFYFHVDPEGAGLGAGVWAPPSEGLLAIRQRIVDRADDWATLKAENGIAIRLDGFETESLKNAPRGFDKEHVHVEDLKRKSVIAAERWPREAIFEDGLPDRVAAFFSDVAGLNRFICSALGLKF